MLGKRLREARLTRHLSLSEVASRAKISVATLSRVERDKQGMDLGMFMLLCKILDTPPQDLLGKSGDGAIADPLAAKIARLDVKERTHLWKELSANVQAKKNEHARIRQLGFEVEELLAQIDFLRDEIEHIQKRLRNGRR